MSVNPGTNPRPLTDVTSGAPIDLRAPVEGADIRRAELHKGQYWIRGGKLGDTTLKECKEIARALGISDVARVWFKFEGENATGTIKARPAFGHVEEAVKLGYKGIAVPSCGDFAEGTAYFAHQRGLECHLFIPDSRASDGVESHIRGYCNMSRTHIHRVKGGYDRVVKAQEAFMREHRGGGIFDARPGSANNLDPVSRRDARKVLAAIEEILPESAEGTDPKREGLEATRGIISNRRIDLRAYKVLANEISCGIRDQEVDMVVMALGNGGGYHCTAMGFSSLGLRPRMIGFTINNPIPKSFHARDMTCPSLASCEVRPPTDANKEISGSIALDGARAIETGIGFGGSIKETFDKFVYKWEKRVEAASEKLLGRNVNLLPVAVATIGGFDNHMKDMLELLQRDFERLGRKVNVVFVLSGERD